MRPVLLAIAGLVTQIVAVLLVRGLAELSYGASRTVPLAWERPLALVSLALFAVAGLGLGTVGAHGLLTCFRLRASVPLVLLLTCPTLLSAFVYFHACLLLTPFA